MWLSSFPIRERIGVGDQSTWVVKRDKVQHATKTEQKPGQNSGNPERCERCEDGTDVTIHRFDTIVKLTIGRMYSYVLLIID